MAKILPGFKINADSMLLDNFVSALSFWTEMKNKRERKASISLLKDSVEGQIEGDRRTRLV